jgi:hypothetical protein
MHFLGKNVNCDLDLFFVAGKTPGYGNVIFAEITDIAGVRKRDKTSNEYFIGAGR